MKKVTNKTLEIQHKIEKYIPSQIEPKWQDIWEDSGLYNFDFTSSKEKYYTLVELPYPSGDLHIGHWFTFVAPDVLSRFKTMQGYNVFFPMGYDAFGLPAENAAIKRKIHPRDWTMSNIKSMTRQFQTMGTMIDWDITTISCLPEYYRWNQWIFIEMFKRGIAYRSKTLSNWCPVDQTVLANEHVENGKCWRCGAEVVQKEVEQWFLRITEYADRLLWENTKEGEASNGVYWPKSVKEGQNNWIGKSEGALINFKIEHSSHQINVFTTRPDTLYGATFLVISPEHDLTGWILKQVQDDKKQEIGVYIDRAQKKSELERKEMKQKTGIFSGINAINPLNNESIPIWIADYVLSGYGTGAIMAVPGHDERDFEFAKKYNLPIHQVISSLEMAGKETTLLKPYIGSGVIINSDKWNGWETPAFISKVIDWLEEKRIGKRQVEYHLHDWSVSRQRYWGTPVPMIHCANCGIVPVSEKDLPIELPYEVDYTPKGKPPLASNKDWLNTICPECGGEAKRDTETLDTFFDSSWYYYRYVSPHYGKAAFDKEKVEKLMPLDIYFGGAEHTLGHTLYARFFTKFFQDLGLVSFDEFAKKRIQHGIVLGPDGNKISKSRGNVINPDDVVNEYGADAVRLYLSFMMPYEATGPWSTTAMTGVYRFLRRVWELYDKVQNSKLKVESLGREDLVQMHKTIQKVTRDIGLNKSNTAVAAIMEWLNHLSRKESVSLEEYKTMLLLLAPFAPHMTEELYQRFYAGISNVKFPISNEKENQKGKKFESIHQQPWPEFDKNYLAGESVIVVIQVNGKRRGEIRVEGSEVKVENSIEEKAKKEVQKHLEGKQVKKVIHIPGKIVNFVV